MTSGRSAAATTWPPRSRRVTASGVALRAQLAGRRADLPLRYWRQQAHLTTPAADAAMARKAVEGGTAPVPRMLERLGLTAADLAERLELPVALLEARLATPARAPLVMLDGEDAIAPGDAAAIRALAVAAETFADADWGDAAGAPSLRFYRPPGFNLETTVRDLYTLLWRLRERTAAGRPSRSTASSFPKVEHPEEVDLVNDLLDRAEAALGLPNGRIRVGYLVESGWGAAQLPEIARRAAPRLASLIFGLADLQRRPGPAGHRQRPPPRRLGPGRDRGRRRGGRRARDRRHDPGLPGRRPGPGRGREPDPLAGPDAPRVRRRGPGARARDARQMGRAPGPVVRGPAGLRGRLTDASLEHEAAKLEAYDAAVAADQGATMIAGVMSDRATDRHARVVLRQATALGRFDPARSVALGVISEAESAEASRAFAAHHRGRRRVSEPIRGWEGRFLEDFTVGDVYRHAHGRTITETDNTWFTLLTNNTHDIHFNADYASRTEFGRPLVVSTLTLAIVTGPVRAGREPERGRQPRLGRRQADRPGLRRRHDLRRVRGARGPPVALATRPGARPGPTRGFNQRDETVITFERTVLVFARAR